MRDFARRPHPFRWRLSVQPVAAHRPTVGSVAKGVRDAPFWFAPDFAMVPPAGPRRATSGVRCPAGTRAPRAHQRVEEARAKRSCRSWAALRCGGPAGGHGRRGRDCPAGRPVQIMRIKQVAKDGALSALAASKPGVQGRARYAIHWRARGRDRPALGSLQGTGGEGDVGGTGGWRSPGAGWMRPPRRAGSSPRGRWMPAGVSVPRLPGA